MELQDKLNKGEAVELNVVDNRDNVLNNTETSHLIGNEIKPEEYNTYPIFKVDEEGKGMTEDGQIFNTDIAFSGRTGMIVQKGNTPLVAIFDNAGLEESQSQLIENVRNEIKTILEKFLNKEQGYSFDEIAIKLKNLLSGNSENKLFSGISITNTDGILNVKA